MDQFFKERSQLFFTRHKTSAFRFIIAIIFLIGILVGFPILFLFSYSLLIFYASSLICISFVSVLYNKWKQSKAAAIRFLLGTGASIGLVVAFVIFVKGKFHKKIWEWMFQHKFKRRNFAKVGKQANSEKLLKNLLTLSAFFMTGVKKFAAFRKLSAMIPVIISFFSVVRWLAEDKKTKENFKLRKMVEKMKREKRRKKGTIRRKRDRMADSEAQVRAYNRRDFAVSKDDMKDTSKGWNTVLYLPKVCIDNLSCGQRGCNERVCTQFRMKGSKAKTANYCLDHFSDIGYNRCMQCKKKEYDFLINYFNTPLMFCYTCFESKLNYLSSQDEEIKVEIATALNEEAITHAESDHKYFYCNHNVCTDEDFCVQTETMPYYVTSGEYRIEVLKKKSKKGKEKVKQSRGDKWWKQLDYSEREGIFQFLTLIPVIGTIYDYLFAGSGFLNKRNFWILVYGVAYEAHIFKDSEGKSFKAKMDSVKNWLEKQKVFKEWRRDTIVLAFIVSLICFSILAYYLVRNEEKCFSGAKINRIKHGRKKRVRNKKVTIPTKPNSFNPYPDESIFHDQKAFDEWLDEATSYYGMDTERVKDMVYRKRGVTSVANLPVIPKGGKRSIYTRSLDVGDRAAYARGRGKKFESSNREYPFRTFAILRRNDRNSCLAKFVSGENKGKFIKHKKGACMSGSLSKDVKLFHHGVNCGVRKESKLKSQPILNRAKMEDLYSSIVRVYKDDELSACATAVGKYLIGSSHYIKGKVGDKVVVDLYDNGEFKKQTVKIAKIVATKDVDGGPEDFVFMTKPQGMRSIPPASSRQGAFCTVVWIDKKGELCYSSGKFDGQGYFASTEEGACGGPQLVEIDGVFRIVGIHNMGGKDKNYPLSFSADFVRQNFQ